MMALSKSMDEHSMAEHDKALSISNPRRDGESKAEATIVEDEVQCPQRHDGRRYNKFGDEPEIPKNNLFIVMSALALITFVSALDQSIVATALPTIAEEFNTSPSEYSWIGTSYLLAQVVMHPINGRLTDIIGRKPALYMSVTLLLIFSALCGAAKNAAWLIVARAFAGLGGGSTVALSLIIVSDVVPLEKRAVFQGWMSAVWGVAGTLGPILGGLFTTKVNWRWCFYINISICSYDFVGLLLIVIAAPLVIVGFSTAADEGFGAKKAYAVIITGIGIMALAVIHFLTTKKNAIIPARLLRTRTTLFFMIGSFFQSLIFMPSLFLLPQFFQGISGASSLRSGIDLVPYSIALSVFGILAGQLTTQFHIVRPVIWVGFAIAALGYGLWYACLTSTVSYATQEGLQVITAAGTGLAISTPMLVIQAAMPGKEMAAATSAWVLMRSMGACVGVAVFTAIFNAGLRSRFKKIDGYGTLFTVPTSASGFQALRQMSEGSTKVQVLKAFADSMRLCWIIGCAFLCFALVLTLFTKSYTLKRNYIAAAPANGSSHIDSSNDDIEKGPANLSHKQEITDKAYRGIALSEDGSSDAAPLPSLPLRS
ncbi:uncharacterized protein L203_100259 [Cryptococcus depauperatus CBS 7841]|uniref:Major facilitator superfamily (MFS) profile domain-containing protein n=1 Tax=Cryptococcus depauperatus CBS 7841 TaxID=1295531 RepID=A0AAJ8JMP3_9TREE